MTRRRKLVHFLVVVALMGMVAGLYETTWNNYLKDVFHIGDQQRGVLEFPREMPGFLVTLVAGALVSMALHRTGAVAMLITAVGFVGLALTPNRYASMVFFMVIWSTGAHLFMPITQSITLGLAAKGRQATRLGQVGAAGILGTIVGASVIAFVMKEGWISFRGVYLLAAACTLLAAGVLLLMGPVERPGSGRRKAFVFKRKYALYYTLCALFGARKQVFMTFGPWVIVKIFERPSSTIANLWLVFCFFGLFLRPLVGHLIDRWGEKVSLFCEGMVLFTVCATYAIAGRYVESAVALAAVMAAYVTDQLAFAISMARTTYLSKIVETREDLPGGLAAGVSIDHAVSMTIPILGGVIWARYGFHYVFWGAAAVALASSAVSLLIRIDASPGEGPDVSHAENNFARENDVE